MVKYQNLIEKLSNEQKTKLLTNIDFFNDLDKEIFSEFNLSIVDFSKILEEIEAHNVSFLSLVNSWDFANLTKVVSMIVNKLKNLGYTHVLIRKDDLNFNFHSYIEEKVEKSVKKGIHECGLSIVYEINSSADLKVLEANDTYLVDENLVNSIVKENVILVKRNDTILPFVSNDQLIDDLSSLLEEAKLDETMNKILEFANKSFVSTKDKESTTIEISAKLRYSGAVVLKKEMLPLKSDKKTCVLSTQNQKDLVANLRKKNLLIDEVSFEQENLENVLVKSGYEVVVIFNAEEIKEKVNKLLPTLAKNNIKVVLFLSSKKKEEYSEAEYCTDLIDLFANDKFEQKEIFKFLLGKVSGTGKLPFRCGKFLAGHGLDNDSLNLDIKVESINQDNNLVLSIRNNGLATSDLVQVYYEKDGQEKTLAGFRKFTLDTKERKNIEIKLKGNIKDLLEDKNKKEKYTFYFGTSNDKTLVKFFIRVENGAAVIEEIVEEKVDVAKFGLNAAPKRKRKAIMALLITILAIDLALVGVNFLLPIPLLFYITVGVNVITLILSIIYVVRNKYISTNVSGGSKNAISFEDLFEADEEKQEVVYEAVDFDDQDEVNREEEEETVTGDEELIIKSLDNKYTSKDVAIDIENYLVSNNIRLSKNVINNFVASLTASHLILFRNENEENLKILLSYLAQYFKGTPYIKDVDASLETSDELFDDDNFKDFLRSANERLDKIHILNLNNVLLENFKKYMNDFIPFIKNYKKSHYINEFLKISPNIFIFAGLNNEDVLENIPEDIAAHSISLTIDEVISIDKERMSEDVIQEQKSLNSYQLDKLITDSKREIDIDEYEFKKFDDIEEYVNKLVPFSFGNKINLQVENFICMYLTLNNELHEAFDLALSQKLLPLLINKLKDATVDSDNSLLAKLEYVFGEDNINLSQKVIKQTSLIGNK